MKAEDLKRELANHEYCVTYDTGPALDALGIGPEDIEASPAMQNGFRLAIKAQAENSNG